MNNTGLFTVVLLIGLGLGMIIKYLLKNISIQWKKIQIILENNKDFAKKQAAVDEMKANGEFHEWITVPTLSGEMLVCKKTGWCPNVKGFVALELINSYLEKVKMEQEYKEYRNARVEKLAKELDFDMEKMETIVESIFSIKKDFHVDRIARLADEFTKRAEDVNKQQN